MRRDIGKRIYRIEENVTPSAAQLEVVDLDEAGKFVEVRWGDKPLARITKEYWEQL